MSDFVLILSLLYCWIFGGSALVFGRASEKRKTRASSWLQEKENFFENPDIALYTVDSSPEFSCLQKNLPYSSYFIHNLVLCLIWFVHTLDLY